MSDALTHCQQCGGTHAFDMSLPSDVWNRVIRGGGYPDTLCSSCIIRAFAVAGESFTATLWGDNLEGIRITVTLRRGNLDGDSQTEKRAADKCPQNARPTKEPCPGNGADIGFPDHSAKEGYPSTDNPDRVSHTLAADRHPVPTSRVSQRTALMRRSRRGTMPDTHWADALVRLGACAAAVEWAKQYPTFQAAWNACGRSDWMEWAFLYISEVTDDVLAEYERQMAPLWAKYLSQVAPPWDEYWRQKAALIRRLIPTPTLKEEGNA